MDFKDVARKRRSIRRYTPTLPDPALVDELIDSARRAPTAGFSQGIDFLVIDDPDDMAAFWRLTAAPDEPMADTADSAGDPPMLVIVWSDPQRYLSRYSAEDKIEFGLDKADAWPVRFWDVDAGMAAMQLQLAAVNEGLATWFFGIAYGEAEVRERFGVPSDRMMTGVVALGYRDQAETPTGSGTTRKRRPLHEQLHRNGW
ncbi:MAG: nitroreductase family protein [Acidimicrobiia bacterium]